MSKLESKLPTQVNRDWAQKVVNEELSDKTSTEKFEIFMEFLKKAKEMTKYCIASPNNTGKNSCYVTGTVLVQNNKDAKGVTSKSKSSNVFPCIACSVDGATDLNSCIHSMTSCMVWNSLSYKDRVSLVKCIKHPFSKDDHLTKDCKRNIRACVHCQKENDHNSLLCPKFQAVKKVSSNVSFKSLTLTSKEQRSQPDLKPTLLFTTFVKTNGNRQLGTLIDNGSTDDYVLNRVAKQMKLPGQPVELITEGFGGLETRIKTNLYYVPVYDKMG